MEALEYMNELIREEHGNRVTMESKWSDAEVDSFGTTMVFLAMDEKYGCYSNDWFRSVTNWKDMPVIEILERITNEGTII